MTIDLTGGLDDELGLVWATQPDEPEMRESVNAWIWDDNLQIGLPRIGVEAVADQWDTHDIQINVAFADGRVFNMLGPARPRPGRRRRQAPQARCRPARLRDGRALRLVADAHRRPGAHDIGRGADGGAVPR